MNEREADFRDWAQANRSRLRSSAYLLCGDWHLADDLVQDALVRVFARWPRVSAGGDPTAYARRVVVNLHLDHRRRPFRREVVRAVLPDHVVGTGPRETDDGRLVAALTSIPPGQRAVLVLRYWEDLSVEQTAEVLGRSPGTVKSQASRGLAALRLALDATHPPVDRQDTP